MTKRYVLLAALLSLVMPGLGQLYNGQLKKALTFIVGGLVLFPSLAWAGLPATFAGALASVGLLLCWRGFAVYDAAATATGLHQFTLKRYNRWFIYPIYWLVVGWGAPPLLARMTPLRAYKISSGSMSPTLEPGDHVMARLWLLDPRVPNRGDVVIYLYPGEPWRVMVHRVVGLPGEAIRIEDKQVFINGRALEEPYAHFEADPQYEWHDLRRDNMAELRLPAGRYFIMGDNRDNSHDGRFWGTLPAEMLRGQPLYVYWNWDRRRIGRRVE